MNWLAAGVLCCAVAVAAGAFGAHALEERLAPDRLALWETAAKYLMYGGLGLAILGLAARLTGHGLGAAGTSLLAGTLIFALTVGALALGAPRWLGAVTPLGGVLMIAGLVLFALAVGRG